MKTFHARRAVVLTVLGGALLTGCVETVVLGNDPGAGGGGADAGSDGPTTSAATTVGPGEGPVTSAATTSGAGGGGRMTATTRWSSPAAHAEFCEHYDPCDLPDDTIFLVIDSQDPVCGLPMGMEGDGTGDDPWRITIALVPELQEVGTYFDGSGEYAHLTYSSSDNTGHGVLEILAIDGLQLTIRVDILRGQYSNPDANGDPRPDLLGVELVTEPCE